MEELLRKLNYQPTNLSSGDLENPEETIDSFFLEYPIHIVRKQLWDLYRGWMYHASEYADTEVTMSMMDFYTQAIDFVDASFINAEKRKEGT